MKITNSELRIIEDLTKYEGWDIIKKYFTHKAEEIEKKILNNVSPGLSETKYSKSDLEKIEAKTYRSFCDIVNTIEKGSNSTILIVRDN